MCGGSRAGRDLLRGSQGTSPRVRGKRHVDQRLDLLFGYIPACAGEAVCASAVRKARKVHPRVCGGSLDDCADDQAPSGTSPRVRGKPYMMHPSTVNGGYIPACAGEALRRIIAVRTPSVHPRVCGGSPNRPRRGRLNMGTSPRVRGKPSQDRSRMTTKGYIPACAGEARRPSGASRTDAVHPRVCGGSRSTAKPATKSRGTSPRVRGKPKGVRVTEREIRYIPACAGEAERRKGYRAGN